MNLTWKFRLADLLPSLEVAHSAGSIASLRDGLRNTSTYPYYPAELYEKAVKHNPALGTDETRRALEDLLPKACQQMYEEGRCKGELFAEAGLTRGGQHGRRERLQGPRHAGALRAACAKKVADAALVVAGGREEGRYGRRGAEEDAGQASGARHDRCRGDRRAAAQREHREGGRGAQVGGGARRCSCTPSSSKDADLKGADGKKLLHKGLKALLQTKMAARMEVERA